MPSTKDRFNLLKSKIEQLEADERDVVKNRVRNFTSVVMDEALVAMRNKTPERPDEPSEIYEHREAKWSEIGHTQPYILEKSPNRSIRLYGMTLKSGWVLPKIDFIGSGKNRVHISASIKNIAPHASMALEGKYTGDKGVSGWEITGNPLHDGRKALAFMRNSTPFFVRPEQSNFPVKFRPSGPLIDIVDAGKNIINSHIDDIKNEVKSAFLDESRVIFR